MTDSETAVNKDNAEGETSTHGRGNNLVDELSALWNEFRTLSYTHLKLATLEAQLAGKSLVIMIIAGMVMGILLSFAWMGLIAAIVLALAEYGVVESNVIQALLAVALNFLAAMILWGVIVAKSRYLRFPATLRALEAKRSESRAPTQEK